MALDRADEDAGAADPTAVAVSEPRGVLSEGAAEAEAAGRLDSETEHVGDTEASGVWLGLGLELGLRLGLGLGVVVDDGVGDAGGGLVVITAPELVGVPVTETVGDDDTVKLPEGELVGEADGVPVGDADAPAAETEAEGVGVFDGEAEGGAPLGEGDAETGTAMRTAWLLWSAMTIAPSGNATALDGLAKAAEAPSPLAKPDVPPKSVVADRVTGSIAMTRLPPVSARRRRAAPAS